MTTLPLNYEIAVGFGQAVVLRNGKVIYDGEKDLHGRGKACTVKKFENMARKKRGKWEIILDAPLWNARYERQGKNKWVEVNRGIGFA